MHRFMKRGCCASVYSTFKKEKKKKVKELLIGS